MAMKTEKTRCSCNPCSNVPVADVQWGSDTLFVEKEGKQVQIKVQTATLCQEHLDTLWGTLNHLVQLNKAWFRIDEVGKINGLVA